jgi:prevent-host-death family protein
MSEVSVRELRNSGGRVLDRVAGGEQVVITRDGHPVAELRPMTRLGLSAPELLVRWKRVPVLDATRLREDLDQALDARL